MSARGGFLNGMELRREGSQLLMEGMESKRISSGTNDNSASMNATGILQRKRTQTQMKNETLKEDTETSSKKVDFQRGIEYSELYTKLCRLLTEGVKLVVKDVFDRFFPPIILQDKLSNTNMQKRLEFLTNKGLIDEKQWVKLYPKTRHRASSANYDTMLFMVMLKHVCKLPPPYPDGWYAEPKMTDDGVSANLARLSLLRKDVVCRHDMSDDEAAHIWDVVIDVLSKFNEEDVAKMAEKIAEEELEEGARYIYVKRLCAVQDRESDIMEREEHMRKKKNTNDIVMMSLNMDMSPEPLPVGSSSMSSRPSSVSTVSQPPHQTQRGGVKYVISNKAQGMPKEERHTLLTFYKSLVTHVKAPEIMDQLIKAEIFNTEDKMTVFLSDKNRERMDALLRILLTKPATAYTEFCKPIKFRHAHLFELMNRTYNTLKKQAAIRKPDGLTHSMEHIQPYCSQLLTKWTPINWSGASATSVREHFTPLQLVTHEGQTIEVKDIIDSSQVRCSVLVEGANGSGKSALCRYLLFGWLTGSIETLCQYALVFLIDCRKDENLQQALHVQMSSEYQFDKEELWHIVEEHQRSILIILDGLEEAEGEYKDLVTRELLPDCGLIVTTRSGALLTQYFPRRLNLIGLDKFHVGEFIKKYMELTNCGPEEFGGFFHKLNDCDEEYQAFVLSPFLCSCLCAIRANKADCNVETETELLEQFLQSLITSQSGKKVDYHDLVNEGVNQLQIVAFNASMSKCSKLSKDEVERKCGRTVFKLGLLIAFDGFCTFLNRSMQDFLTARYITTLKTQEFNHIVDALRQDRSLSDVCRFLCGMQAKFENSAILENIIKDIGHHNLAVHRAVRFLQGSDHVLRGLMTARVSELSLSLQCVHESKGCTWIAKMVAESLPNRLVMKSSSVPQNALLGLADILRLNLEGVSELDIHITEEMNIKRHGLLKIAESLRNNDKISYVRIEWTCSELFSKFLCDTFSNETRIRTIKMVDRSRKSHDMMQNALIQAQLLHAFKKMSHIDSIIFQDCKDAGMLVSILRNCNLQVKSLDLTGCRFNIICAKELAHFLEYTTNLASLNLTSVKLSGTVFPHFVKGLKVNKTVHELILCNCKIDQMGELLLAECLQFNSGLKKLDISKNALSWTGCRQISQAIMINQNIDQLIVFGGLLTQKCVAFFKMINRNGFQLFENSQRPGTADVYAD